MRTAAFKRGCWIPTRCPSLGCAVDVEKAVIYPMLCDLLHTVGPAAMNVQWGLYPDNYCRGSSATATGEWP